MRLQICAVGRLKGSAEADLADHYRHSFMTMAAQVGLSALDVVEIDDRKGPKGPRAKDWQAARLIEKVPAGARIVAWDESGKALSSRDFASLLMRWRDDGLVAVAFLIGGADGHGRAALDRADHILSLGPMTWPHMLARVLVLEQIYRTACILARHPYHHG